MRKKIVSPAHRRAVARRSGRETGLCSQRAACRILRLARSTYRLSRTSHRPEARTVKEAALGTVGGTSALRVSADRGVVASGRLAGGQTTDSTAAPSGRTACAADEAEGGSARRFHGFADTSAASEPCVDVGFPNFTQIIIHRPSASGTNWQDLKINLTRAFDSGDCAGDIPLQFGDVVEIPEADHVVNEPWMGLTTNELFTLKNCLTRHLQITVNGQTTNLTVAPQVWELVPGSSEYPLSSLGAKMPPEVGLLKFEPFMLWPVLENSKLLLASSDLSRVQVKRRDAATGKTHEWTVDCSNSNSPPDFWLRDGDVIGVPEKP